MSTDYYLVRPPWELLSVYLGINLDRVTVRDGRGRGGVLTCAPGTGKKVAAALCDGEPLSIADIENPRLGNHLSVLSNAGVQSLGDLRRKHGIHLANDDDVPSTADMVGAIMEGWVLRYDTRYLNRAGIWIDNWSEATLFPSYAAAVEAIAVYETEDGRRSRVGCLVVVRTPTGRRAVPGWRVREEDGDTSPLVAGALGTTNVQALPGEEERDAARAEAAATEIVPRGELTVIKGGES